MLHKEKEILFSEKDGLLNIGLHGNMKVNEQ